MYSDTTKLNSDLSVENNTIPMELLHSNKRYQKFVYFATALFIQVVSFFIPRAKDMGSFSFHQHLYVYPIIWSECTLIALVFFFHRLNKNGNANEGEQKKMYVRHKSIKKKKTHRRE